METERFGKCSQEASHLTLWFQMSCHKAPWRGQSLSVVTDAQAAPGERARPHSGAGIRGTAQGQKWSFLLMGPPHHDLENCKFHHGLRQHRNRIFDILTQGPKSQCSTVETGFKNEFGQISTQLTKPKSQRVFQYN